MNEYHTNASNNSVLKKCEKLIKKYWQQLKTQHPSQVNQVPNIMQTQLTIADLKQELSLYRKALLESLMINAASVEARDPYTGGHLWRVSRLSMTLARLSGLDNIESTRIGIAGFLHDIGKIAIPDEILHKPGKLSDDEFAVIKQHPEIGASLLAGHPLAPLVEKAISMHHETPNGKGYPLQKQGDDIPIEAKIVGICDAFDAMTSTRPYRKGMPIEKALNIIEQELGNQFDSELGLLFIKHGRQGEWDHIVGHTEDGIPLGDCPVCGPVLVRTNETKEGDQLTCPACLAEFNWQKKSDEWLAVPNGQRALFALNQPNTNVIEQLVLQWSKLQVSD